MKNFDKNEFDGKLDIEKINIIIFKIKSITNNFIYKKKFKKYEVIGNIVLYISMYFTFIGIIFIIFEFLFTLIVNISLMAFLYILSLILYFIRTHYFRKILKENKLIIEYLNNQNENIYNKIGINFTITFSYDYIWLIYYKDFEKYKIPSDGLVFNKNLFYEKFRTLNLNIINSHNFPNMNHFNIKQLNSIDEEILNLENEYVFDKYEVLN